MSADVVTLLASLGRADLAVELGPETAEVRLVRDVDQRARLRTRTKQRALRPGNASIRSMSIGLMSTCCEIEVSGWSSR
jgi:hypothetical protein